MSGSNPPRAVPLHRRRDLLALGVYLSLLAFIAATYSDYGISWDEEFYVESGRAYVDHFFDMDAFADEVASIHVETHGALFDGLYTLALRGLGRSGDYETLHLLKALTSSLAVVLVYVLLCRLQPRESLIPVAGMLLLVFLPAWLGQIFDAHMDGAAALLYAAQIAWVLPLLDFTSASRRSGTRRALAIVGLGVLAGVSFSHRVPLVTVSASLFLLWLGQAVATRRIAMWLGLSGVFAASFYATVFVVDPYVRVEWWTGVWDKIFYAANPSAVSHMLVLFDGEVRPVAELPRSYLRTWMGISIPVLTLGLVALGTAKLARWLALGSDPERRRQAALLLLSLALPLGAVFVTRAVVFDGWRHLLFLAGPLVVVASVGLAWLTEAASSRSPRIARAVWVGFGLALVPIAVSMARLHPYEYVYINAFGGGLAGTDARYENDYWAKSYKAAAEWVRERAEAQPRKSHAVYVCGPVQAAAYYFSPNMTVAEKPRDADYIICFSRPGWSGWAPRSRPDHTIERDGVALTRIWAR